MRFFANFILSIIRLAAGILILLFAAGIPAYFVSVDKDAVIAAGRDTPMPINLARIYFDGAKLSTAMLVARAAAEDSELSQAVETLYKEHPQWIIAGGDEPFFDAFASTLTTKIGFLDRYKMYSILSLGENRKSCSIPRPNSVGAREEVYRASQDDVEHSARGLHFGGSPLGGVAFDKRAACADGGFFPRLSQRFVGGYGIDEKRFRRKGKT